jgi:hypothetical protein
MPEPHYQLDIDRNDTFLHAVVTGSNTAETVLGYMGEIRDACEANDCHRVLIEEKLEGPRFDEMEVFSLISEGASDALGVFEAIAYVDEQQDFDIVKFAETVAVNRGIPIAVFTSVADAQNWLRHRREDAPEQDMFTDEHGSDD